MDQAKWKQKIEVFVHLFGSSALNILITGCPSSIRPFYKLSTFSTCPQQPQNGTLQNLTWGKHSTSSTEFVFLDRSYSACVPFKSWILMCLWAPCFWFLHQVKGVRISIPIFLKVTKLYSICAAWLWIRPHQVRKNQAFVFQVTVMKPESATVCNNAPREFKVTEFHL